ncbi:hypothetical protein NUSPORA_01787 [Nucleospora cyclopteri]
MNQQKNVINDIDSQVNMLQNKLKGRLKQTQDLSDLNTRVFKSSLKIEESTAELKETSIKTKWKWFFEYLKWLIIAFVIFGLMLLILLRLIFGS